MKRFLSPLPWQQSTGIALLRLIMGFFMIYHGWEIFDAAKMNGYFEWGMFKSNSGRVLAYVGKIAELIGGVILFLGFLTRVAALILVATMTYITFFVGNGIIWYEDQHPFMFVLLGLVFVFTGPGRWSLDQKVFAK
jgi:putative oxidoreductase